MPRVRAATIIASGRQGIKREAVGRREDEEIDDDDEDDDEHDC
ncbi:hypothetical protein ACFL09_06380 [Planctomycetota bacterium]